jgi:glycerophosphoryl diester phosphodiesterase
MRRERVVLSILVIVAAVAGVIVPFGLPEPVRQVIIRNTVGLAPQLFYRDLEGDLLDDYENVYAVAHNAGDRLGATKAAIEYGADIIEIDVISVGNVLYAGHDVPSELFGTITYSGPTLDLIWAEAVTTGIVKFDLKESTPSFINLVIAFLKQRSTEVQVILATRSQAALAALRPALPSAILLYSVSGSDALRSMRDNEPLLAVIDGVTIPAGLLNDDNVTWMKSLRLLIFAWTVNRLELANELVRLGVSAITTDNLAIMELLGATDRPISRSDTQAAATNP